MTRFFASNRSHCLQINTVVFDKTGTITVGKPRMSRIVAVTDAARDCLTELLLLTAAAEANSEHPIAKACRMFSSR